MVVIVAHVAGVGGRIDGRYIRMSKKRRRDCRVQITRAKYVKMWWAMVKKAKRKEGEDEVKMPKRFDYSFVRAVKTLGYDHEEFANKLKLFKSSEKGMEKTMKLMKNCGFHHSDISQPNKIKFVRTIMANTNFDDAKCVSQTKKESPQQEPPLTKDVYAQIHMFARNLKTAHVNCGKSSIGDIIKAMLQNVMSLR